MLPAVIVMPDYVERSTKRIAELEAALSNVMVGGNHLVGIIDDILPKGTPHDQALEHYSAGAQYDAWCCWNAIMQARDVLQKPE